MFDPTMYQQPPAQPQDQTEYADPTRMKRLGQEDRPMDPYMRRMMMAQALGGQGGGQNMSPMGSAMGGFARGMGQGMAFGGAGGEAGKSAGLMGAINQLFGGQKGF